MGRDDKLRALSSKKIKAKPMHAYFASALKNL
jgi:hypothetical protein